MLLQHLVCHVALLAERQTGHLEPAYRWLLRRRWAKCTRIRQPRIPAQTCLVAAAAWSILSPRFEAAYTK